MSTRYPVETTIVLQHQFWSLKTADGGFSVTLSFGGRRERLTVPFNAVISFLDPAVNFRLRFEPRPEGGAEDALDGTDAGGQGDDSSSATVVSLDEFRKT